MKAVDACMRANIPQRLQIKQVTLRSQDAQGQQRMLKGRLFARPENGLLRVMFKLDGPADLRGTAYLLRESEAEADAMYMFLPALNKTRRIVGGSQHQALFGTDISYADIRQIASAFGAGRAIMESPESLQSRPMQVLSLQPDAAQASPYQTIRAWVDVQTCVVMQADFIAKGELRKRYSVAAVDLRQSGKHWYALKSVMEDRIARTRTELLVDELISDPELSDRYFDPRLFQLGN